MNGYLRDLLEIVDDRYEKGSLLITSQIPIGRWHELIGDHTIGDAILDRVIHRAGTQRSQHAQALCDRDQRGGEGLTNTKQK